RLGQCVRAGEQRAAVEERIRLRGGQGRDLGADVALPGGIPGDLDDLDVGPLDGLPEALLVRVAEVVVLDEHGHRRVGLLLGEDPGEHLALERVRREGRADQPRVVRVAPRRRARRGEQGGHAEVVQRVADGDVVRRADDAEHRERVGAVRSDELVDVRRCPGGVVLVVLGLELEGERALADLHPALVVHHLEVAAPSPGDLGEGRGEARLRVAGHEPDDVALDLLAGVGGAVLGGDGGGLLLALAVTPVVPGVSAVVVAAARRGDEREDEQRGEKPRGTSSHGCSSWVVLSWVVWAGPAVAGAGAGAGPEATARRPRRASRRRTPPTSPSGSTNTMKMRLAPKMAGERISLPSMRSW